MSGAPPPPSPHAPRTVLIVGEAAARVAPFFEEGSGDLAVRVSRDADAAQEAVRSGRIDAVLLDLSLTPADASRTIDRLRAADPGLPVILLADVAERELARRLASDGAHAYLPREAVDSAVLRRTLLDAIRLRRLEDEARALRATVEESQERFRNVIERNADGIVIVDAEGTIRFANPAAQRLFGRDPDALLGAPFGFPLVTGEMIEMEVLRADRTPVTVEMRLVSTTWEGRDAHLASLRDVTDRKRAEERARDLAREHAAREAAERAERRQRKLARESAALALENRQLLEKAESASRAKSDFLAVMSHELRTPLNAIIGFADLLEAGIGGELQPQQQHYIGRIQGSASHLLELVEEILTFTRLEEGEESARSEEVDLATVMAEAAAIAEPLARKKEIRFVHEAPDAPIPRTTDPAKVRQILINLLSNAAKFTPSGEVRLFAERDGDDVLVHVADTGIGIDPADQETVFEPFWQVEQDSTRVQGGAGLGLTVARRLATLIGASLTLRSRPGAGSTFSLRLPAHAAAPAGPPLA